jgi:Uma2 family endonuclease
MENRRGGERKGEIPMTQPGRTLTAADLAELPTLLPSGSVRYELDAGELQLMSPTGEIHGGVEASIASLLKVQGEWQGHGKVRSGEVGIVLRRGPDTVVGADVVFLTNDQIPPRRSPEGYLETVPALVVEVVSNNDRRRQIVRKVRAYLAAGARAVWVADPEPRTHTIHRAGAPPVVLTESDTLTAEEIVPDLSFSVSRLFEGLD